MTRDWRHLAACQDEDPELFFPVGTSGPALLQTAEAISVCQLCPVVKECLAWALATNTEYGVCGGLSESDRRNLRRRPTPTRPGQPTLEPTKTCRVCDMQKPVSGFHRDRTERDGYNRRCKTCASDNRLGWPSKISKGA